MVDDTSKGFLVPSKANRTLAQALDCFQGDFAAPRLGAQNNNREIIIVIFGCLKNIAK